MSPTPPIPESLWNTVPRDAQAALMAVFEPLAQLDGGLEDAPAGRRGVQVQVIPGGPEFETSVDM